MEIDAIEAWNGILRIKREMNLRDVGVVVTHRITATGTAPVKFQLVDRFPSRLEADDVGFHPEHEPAHGRIDAEQVLISDVVDPEEELVVRYGVCPTRAHTPEEIEELQFSTPPSIELAEAVEGETVDQSELEAATMTRSSAEDEGSSPLFSKLLGPLWREGDAEVGGTEAAEQPEDGRPEPARDTMVGRAEAGVDVEEVPGPDDEDEQAEEEEGEEPAEPEKPPRPGPDDGGDEATDEDEEGSEGIGTGGDPFGPSEDNSALAAAISRAHDRDEPEDDDAGTSTDWLAGEDEGTGPGDAAGAGIDPVDVLLDRLESGDLTDRERERLGRSLATLIEEVDSPSKLTSLRLRNLEAEVHAMASYRAALEEIIDEHGPAEEFLADVRGEIEAVADRLDDHDRELEAAADERTSFGERLDSLHDEVSVLSSRIERLDDRVDSLRANHRSKLTALEERIKTLEPALERVEELEDDLDSVRRTAERAERTRRVLADALQWDEVDEE